MQFRMIKSLNPNEEFESWGTCGTDAPVIYPRRSSVCEKGWLFGVRRCSDLRLALGKFDAG